MCTYALHDAFLPVNPRAARVHVPGTPVQRSAARCAVAWAARILQAKFHPKLGNSVEFYNLHVGYQLRHCLYLYCTYQPGRVWAETHQISGSCDMPCHMIQMCAQ